MEGANSHQSFSLSIPLLYHFFLIKRKGIHEARRCTWPRRSYIEGVRVSPFATPGRSRREVEFRSLEDRHLTEVDSVGRFPRRVMMVNNILARLRGGLCGE